MVGILTGCESDGFVKEIKNIMEKQKSQTFFVTSVLRSQTAIVFNPFYLARCSICIPPKKYQSMTGYIPPIISVTSPMESDIE